MRETDRRLDEKLGKLGDRLGEMIEYMVMPSLVGKFRELGFVFTKAYPHSNIKDEENNMITGFAGSVLYHDAIRGLDKYYFPAYSVTQGGKMIEEAVVDTVVIEMNNYFIGNDDCFSGTRDVFTARVQSFVLETKKYLEAAIIGEIGNNTFDHNFGFNSNFPRGAYCNLAHMQKYIVLADYGKGVRQSLLFVLPSITSDVEAVEIAFTRRISGRSPEQRGNGLKFVSEAVQQNNWNLYFQSGFGSCSIDRNGIRFFEKAFSVIGCLAIFDFDGDK